MAVVLPFLPAAEPAPAPRPRAASDRASSSSRPARSTQGRLALALDAQRAPGRAARADPARRGRDLAATTSGSRSRASPGSASSTSPRARPIRCCCAASDPYRCIALEALPWRQVGGTRVVALSEPRQRRGGDRRLRRRRRRAWRWRWRRPRTCGGRSPRPSPGGCATTRASAARRPSAAATWTAPRATGGRSPASRRAAGGRRGGAAAGAAARARLGAARQRHDHGPAARGALRPAASAAGSPAADMPRLADYMKLPRVSMLVPLYARGGGGGAAARGARRRWTIRAPLLDIKLVLEADDTVTRAAIDRATLPPTIEVVTVPADALQAPSPGR